MTSITGAKRRWRTSTAAVAILAATFTLGGLAGSANAEHRDWHHHEDRRDWNGGYYRAPPVVYGTPYYAPPVIWGPGLSINIR